MFRFNSSRLQIKKELGKGRFGKVYPYQKDPEDVKWVVKRIKAGDSDELVACLPEIVLGFSCDHPCVVPVKGYFIEKNSDGEGYNIYMKLPRMKETLLSDFKERKKNCNRYSEQEIVRHFYSLVCGVKYLHGKKIYHGDIKPDNMLLDEQGNAKVADIGIAKHVEEEDSYQTLAGSVGTYYYSAPEIFGKMVTKDLLPKADIWSIGAVVLELCVFDFRQLNSLSSRDEIQTKLDELFKRIQGKYHDSLFVLIQNLLNLDPNKRPEIGQIKTELEKHYPHIIDKELSLENFNLIQADKGPEIKALNQKLKETSELFEIEAKQLKKTISQLEQQLIQEKQHHEARIKDLVSQSNSKAREEHSKEKFENVGLKETIKELEKELGFLRGERNGHRQTIANTNEKLRRFEEQIRMLEREKISYEQRSGEMGGEADARVNEQQMKWTIANANEKLRRLEEQIRMLELDKISSEQRREDLQRYLDTSIKEQMKAYEEKIKVLQESQLKEKIQFDQEKKKILENLNALQLKLEDGRNVKIEAKQKNFDEDYDKNLKKMILKLRGKWGNSFAFEEKDRKLIIENKRKDIIIDASVSGLSKDLIDILDEHHLFNLFGLEIDLSDSGILTDKALEYLATALSNQALHLQHLTLNFGCCNELTDKALEYVAKALSNQALHLQHLTLNFASCQQLTDKAFGYVATALSYQALHLQHLTLIFWSIPQISDIGADKISTAIQDSYNLQDLYLGFASWERSNKVTRGKKESLRQRFAHIPKLKID